MLDMYSPCPCGSGKKFKWCCQPIHVQIDKAFQADEDGQHDAALRLMEEMVAEHPTNPEAWGRRAELLFRNDRAEEAETSLQKAIDINPNYPFGHLLRGLFRQHEGETTGALIEFRKAVEAYDPEARGPLGNLQALIAEAELRQNHPVAGHAALQIAQRLAPSEDLAQALDGYFGDNSTLPASARKKYTFLAAPAGLAADQKSAWDQALDRAATGKLSDAAKAFQALTESDPNNSAAWFNLALARAWLGLNKQAVEALDRYLPLEADEAKAAAAWALGEVLRLGRGMEDQADVVSHSYSYTVRDPQPVSVAIQDFQTQRRLLVIEAPEDKPVFHALILEKTVALTPELAAALSPRLGSYFVILGDQVRLWHTNAESVAKIVQEFLQKAAPGLVDPKQEKRSANFSDVLAAALVFPMGVTDNEEARRRVMEGFQKHFEEQWIHQPLKALGGVPPIDAVGHATLKKKLLGVIQFLEECRAVTSQPYDFARLRGKLGLAGPAAATVAKADGGVDYSALSAADLAGLKVDGLTASHLEQAFQSAVKLEARELAGKFAQEIVGRPPQADRPDRWPWFTHLFQLALFQGQPAAAFDHLNEGEKHDCTHNEGKRRNDYELRRGQLHAKQGEAPQAQDIFDRLIDRAPDELRYRASAAESLLSARQGALALKYAEGGLVKARQLQNRDSEHHFLELIEAAKRAGK